MTLLTNIQVGLTVVAVAILSSVFMLPQGASAQTEGLVCAAVMPCNPDGTVMAPFNDGECAPMYRAQCLSLLTNNLQEDLEMCKVKLQASRDSHAKTQRTIRKLRKEMAASKRR